MGINQGPISLDQKYTARNRPRIHDRNAGAGAPADGADAARPRQRAEDRGASSPAIAARRSAVTTSSSWRRASISKSTASNSSPA